MQAKKKPRRAPAPAPAAPDRPPRERILNAAFGAFMELGYAETSMLEIATRARVSKRDLYANFADKGAILAACVETRAKRMRMPLDLAAPRDRDGLRETLVAFGIVSLREGTLPTSVAALRLAAIDAEAGRVFNAAALEANREALNAYVAKAQAAGLLAAGDPQRIAGLFLSVLWGNTLTRLLLRVAEAPAEDEIERRARDAARLILRIFGRESS